MNGTAIRPLGGAILGAVLALNAVLSTALAEETGVTHRVVIENFNFVPANLSIVQGDAVEWINQDVVPHTATEESGVWDTRNIATGQSAKVVFSLPGTIHYVCAYHPHMRGAISVSMAGSR